MAVQAPLFRNLNADDEDQETTEIESCCMNCFQTVNNNISINSK